MGVKFRLILYSQDPEAADQLARESFQRVAELEQIASHYRDDSELSRLRLSAFAQPTKLSSDLNAMLALALNVAKASDGAFDPTLLAWTRFQSESGSRAAAKIEAEAAWAAARERVGWSFVEHDARAATIRLRIAGLGLDLGGIAKGYAADQIAAYLRSHGCERFLIDAGGDLLLGDPPPERTGWTIGVGEENSRREFSRCSVATSGSRFRKDGGPTGQSSHIIDPQAGTGIDVDREFSVRASRAAIADALATAACVLGPGERLRRLLARYDAELIAP